MTKSHTFLLLIGLVVGFGGAVVRSSPGVRESDIKIVSEPRPHPSAEPFRSLGRKFETAPCSSRKTGRTILEVLRPRAKKILVHQYDNRAWRNIGAVKDYIRRVLSAEPEGGMLGSGVYWAEFRAAEIIASVEFSNGQRRPIELANGYAHFEDLAGCEWWARYLGPDRSKWVVRP